MADSDDSSGADAAKAGGGATDQQSHRRIGRPPVELDSTLNISASDGEVTACPVGAGAALGPGTVIGHYEIDGRLGAGGMGIVYAAHDRDLDRKVALKFLHDQASADRRARLKREAQAMARIAHPNVIVVHEVGTHQGHIFIAMEHVDGCTLREWCARQRSHGEIVEVFASAGRGLAAAHSAGLVHRDFKPENVLVGDDGRVLVADFGLASLSDRDFNTRLGDDELLTPTVTSSQLTRTGARMGTPFYMAPEQHRGQGSAASDQFGFCVALYEALYGERPFTGANYAELVANVSKGEIPAPRDDDRVPRWLRTLVVRGLATAPDDRHLSMAALVDALARDPAPARRRRCTTAAIAVAMVVASLFAVWALMHSQPAAPQRCEGAYRQMLGVWDAPTRARIRAIFAASGRPYAVDTYARVAALVDAYVDSWVTMHNGVCTAPRRAGELSTELFDLRMACLDRRRHELLTATTLWGATPDPEVVDRAVAMAGALIAVDGCADAVALTSTVAPPSDPVVRERVADWRRSLAVARVHQTAGQYGAGIELVRALLLEVGKDGFAPLRAEALLLRGELEEQNRDPASAEVTLLEAARVAAGARHDEVAAAAWLKLVAVVGHRLARHQEGAGLIAAAEAAVERAGGSPQLRAKLHMSKGYVANTRGDYEQARVEFGRAIELIEASAGADALAVASPINDIGTAWWRLGDYEQAGAAFTRALTIWERTLGPEHPNVAAVVNNLGLLATSHGEYEQASVHFERSIAIKEKVLGERHRALASTLINLGQAQHGLERLAAARASYTRAMGILEETLGGDHPHVGIALLNLGEVEQDEGRFADARAHCQRAQTIWAAQLPANHPYFANGDSCVGRSLFGLGRPRAAVAPLERALVALDNKAGDPTALAGVRFALARALWDGGDRGRRALTLARQARAVYAAGGAAKRARLESVDRWLASR